MIILRLPSLKRHCPDRLGSPVSSLQRPAARTSELRTAIGAPAASPLAELEAPPSLRLAIFLSLDRPGVAGQEPGYLQNAAQVRLIVCQRPADSMPHRAGLTRQPAAIDRANHVELVVAVRDQERLGQQHPQHGPREILHDRAAVHRDLTLAGFDPNAGYRLLSPPR